MWDNWTEDLPRVTRRRVIVLLALGLAALSLFFVAEHFLGESLHLDPESLRT